MYHHLRRKLFELISQNINQNCILHSPNSDLEGNNINYIHEQAFAAFTQLEDL